MTSIEIKNKHYKQIDHMNLYIINYNTIDEIQDVTEKNMTLYIDILLSVNNY